MTSVIVIIIVAVWTVGILNCYTSCRSHTAHKAHFVIACVETTTRVAVCSYNRLLKCRGNGSTLKEPIYSRIIILFRQTLKTVFVATRGEFASCSLRLLTAMNIGPDNRRPKPWAIPVRTDSGSDGLQNRIDARAEPCSTEHIVSILPSLVSRFPATCIKIRRWIFTGKRMRHVFVISDAEWDSGCLRMRTR